LIDSAADRAKKRKKKNACSLNKAICIDYREPALKLEAARNPNCDMSALTKQLFLRNAWMMNYPNSC
jgi:hypothetical protein